LSHFQSNEIIFDSSLSLIYSPCLDEYQTDLLKAQLQNKNKPHIKQFMIHKITWNFSIKVANWTIWSH